MDDLARGPRRRGHRGRTTTSSSSAATRCARRACSSSSSAAVASTGRCRCSPKRRRSPRWPLALDDDSAWNALLAVQTSGTRPPLFVVHDGIGSVYSALAAWRLSSGPISRSTASAAKDSTASRCRSAHSTELAATYIERIRALYPHGPYVLYGASLGGVIAMEMARQLKEAGEEVPLVALGDSMSPTGSAPGAEHGGAPRHATRGAQGDDGGRTRAARSCGWPGGRSRIACAVSIGDRQAAPPSGAADRRRTRPDRRPRATARGEQVPVRRASSYILREYGGLLRGHQPRGPHSRSGAAAAHRRARARSPTVAGARSSATRSRSSTSPAPTTTSGARRAAPTSDRCWPGRSSHLPLTLA